LLQFVALALLLVGGFLSGCGSEGPQPSRPHQLPRGTVYYSGPMVRKGDELHTKKGPAAPTKGFHGGIPVE